MIARSLEAARDFEPCAVAIGVFDGVHLGHQALLRRTREIAAELNIAAAVLTFDPHPACVVAPSRAPRLLYTINDRCALLAEQAIDQVLVLPFTQKVANISARDFAQLLRDVLKAEAIIVGEDFRFGRGREGSVQTLSDLGFDVRPVTAFGTRGVIVSSSEIRRRIDVGDVSMAGRLLGRPYAIDGSIVRGHGIGTTQTVPTLNLLPSSEIIPRGGVYITRTTDAERGTRWKSITNIGVRPTFSTDEVSSIETFLLEPLTTPSPARIQLEFLRRVRDERKFDSSVELKAQILKDVATAQRYFRRLHW
jgi:riboflavin kinase / FMN adenylyltransferase